MKGKKFEYYEEWHRNHRDYRLNLYQKLTAPFYVNRRESVCRLLEPGGRYLDLGCGDGSLIEAARGLFDEWYGVDISEAAIEKADERLRSMPAPGAKLSCLDIDSGNLEFGDAMFDCVSCVAMLEHVFDPIHAMEEIIRVTKKGGMFVINVPNIAYARHRLKLLLGRRPRTSAKQGWDGGHIQYFTVHDFRSFFAKRGVGIEKTCGGSGRFMSVRNLWPAFLSADLVVKCRKK